MSSRRPGRHPGPGAGCWVLGAGRTGAAALVPALFLRILTGANPTASTTCTPWPVNTPAVAALARHVPLGAAVLEDLEAHGVDAPVWHALTTDTTPGPGLSCETALPWNPRLRSAARPRPSQK